MAEPDIAVVIPTRDRREALVATLAALDAQRDVAREVAVVDNGSTDGTLPMIEGRPGVRVEREPRPGPAAARNRGVTVTRAPVVLFLGDDTAPAGPDLLAAHVRLHRARPERGYAVLGRVAWRPDRPVTPFMHWLEHGGPQFAFSGLQAGPAEPAKHFYTSHVSVKRDLLAAVGGFDERFPFAAVEDAELGVRLEAAGVTLDYHPELLVHHDHPTAIGPYARRMERSGASAALLHALHPDDRTASLPRPRRRWWHLPVTGPAAEVAARLPLPLPLRRHAWSLACMARYARGYRRAPAMVPAVTRPSGRGV